MTAQELAEKILSWIKHTEEEMAKDDPLQISGLISRYTVLVDDIEKLCKEQREK